MNEFELIQRYFSHIGQSRPDVVVGVGDDAAVCTVPKNQELVVTTDLLVAGIHFPDDTPAHAIGYKALAVNLSDLAAMGAEPAWFTMTLSLPEPNESWLQEFARGLSELAEASGVLLIGGDTTRGALTIGIQACGFVPTDSAILRSGARVGDHIFVTGTLGDATLGLKGETGKLSLSVEAQKYFSQRLRYPTPRTREGLALRGIASAMIDISDGLVADLGHVLESSAVGASIQQGNLPVSDYYKELVDQIGWDAALSGGDDYELCIVVPPDHVASLNKLAAEWDCRITEIGIVDQKSGLRIVDEEGSLIEVAHPGYEHFSEQ